MFFKSKFTTLDSNSPKSEFTRTHTNKSNAAPKISAETTNFISLKLKEKLQKTRSAIKNKKLAFDLNDDNTPKAPKAHEKDIYAEPQDFERNEGFIEQLGKIFYH